MHRHVATTFASLAALTPIALAQVHNDWQRTFDASPTGIDVAQAVGVAPSGNVYAAGRNGARATLLLKYDAAGALQWSRSITYGVYIDSFISLTIDPSSEDVYAVGRTDQPGHSTGGFVVKYDALGNLLWSRTVYPPQGTAYMAVARLDNAGNLLTAGLYGPGNGIAIKYDPAGNLVWSTVILGGDLVTDVASDPFGNSLVAGAFDVSNGNRVFKVAKFDATGALTWLRDVSGGGVGAAIANTVVSDASGAIYAAGRIIDATDTPLAALVKLDPAGNVLWTRTSYGTDLTPSYYGQSLGGIAFAPNGNIRVAGVTTNIGTEADIRTLEYDPSGALVWDRTWDGASHEVDSFLGIRTEGDGSLTVLARTELPGEKYDPAALRYDTNGNLLWANVNLVSATLDDNVFTGAFGPGGERAYVGNVINSPSTTTDALVVSERDEVFSFCFGDAASAACPCGNNGSVGNGCANSAFSSGAHLGGSGVPSVAADSMSLAASNMTGSIAIFFQGATQTPHTVIDDGLGCVGGPIIRLRSTAVSGSAAVFPGAGDPSVSVRGAIPPAGGTFYYQCFYRNAVAAFCPPSTSNRTNAIAITWSP